MKRPVIRTTLAVLVTCAAAVPLLAQVPVPNQPAPPPTQQPAMQPVAPPPKPLNIQITGAMTIPVFNYTDLLDDLGWQAQGALILRKGPFNHIRLEGEYNSIAYEGDLGGSAEVYGGGIGGGRVAMKGTVQSEGYGVIGLYQHQYSELEGELQFGLKVGGNFVMGRGKVRPVIDLHWLTTFSQPYVNLITIGAGLRF